MDYMLSRKNVIFFQLIKILLKFHFYHSKMAFIEPEKYNLKLET